MAHQKVKFLIILPLLIIILTSCVDLGREEINDLAMVMAVGIDYNSETNLREVTAQIARPGAAREETGASTGEPIWTAMAEGETIFDAIRNLGRYSSRRVFWAHTFIVVISEDCAREGIADVIDFFARNNELRMHTWVVVTSGKARELVATNTGLEIIPAESLDKVFRYSPRQAEAPQTDMLDLAAAYINEDYHPVLGRVEIQSREVSADRPGEYGSSPQVELSGTAIFEHDKMLGWLGPEESRGLLWFIERVGEAIIPLPCPHQPNNSASLELRENQYDLETMYKDGKPAFKVDITSYVDLVELGCPTDRTHAELFKQFEEELEKKLKHEIEMMLEKVQQDYQVDVLRLGRAVENRYPVEWRKIRDDWKEIFPTVDVDVNVEVHINSPGLLESPLRPKKD